jgi:hypothetical protein
MHPVHQHVSVTCSMCLPFCFPNIYCHTLPPLPHLPCGCFSRGLPPTLCTHFFPRQPFNRWSIPTNHTVLHQVLSSSLTIRAGINIHLFLQESFLKSPCKTQTFCDVITANPGSEMAKLFILVQYEKWPSTQQTLQEAKQRSVIYEGHVITSQVGLLHKWSTKCQSCKAVTDTQTVMLINNYHNNCALYDFCQNLLHDFILLMDYHSLKFQSCWPKIYFIYIYEHDSSHCKVKWLLWHHFPNTAKTVVS